MYVYTNISTHIFVPKNFCSNFDHLFCECQRFSVKLTSSLLSSSNKDVTVFKTDIFIFSKCFVSGSH